MAMGDNIHAIAEVDLSATGALFFANDLPGLAISLTAMPASLAPGADTVFAGDGGNTITDTSTGGNTLSPAPATTSSSSATISPRRRGDVIANFAAAGRDTIFVPLLTTTEVTLVGNNLDIGGTLDPVHVVLTLAGGYSGSFVATHVQFGGTEITFTGTVTPTTSPALPPARAFLTARGEVAVENLLAGDAIPTLLAGGPAMRRIKWIGRTQVDLDRHPAPHKAAPIRIVAGAFGEGVPHRDPAALARPQRSSRQGPGSHPPAGQRASIAREPPRGRVDISMSKSTATMSSWPRGCRSNRISIPATAAGS